MPAVRADQEQRVVVRGQGRRGTGPGAARCRSRSRTSRTSARVVLHRAPTASRRTAGSSACAGSPGRRTSSGRTPEPGQGPQVRLDLVGQPAVAQWRRRPRVPAPRAARRRARSRRCRPGTPRACGWPASSGTPAAVIVRSAAGPRAPAVAATTSRLLSSSQGERSASRKVAVVADEPHRLGRAGPASAAPGRRAAPRSARPAPGLLAQHAGSRGSTFQHGVVGQVAEADPVGETAAQGGGALLQEPVGGLGRRSPRRPAPPSPAAYAVSRSASSAASVAGSSR